MEFTKSITGQASRIVDGHFSGWQLRTVNIWGRPGQGKTTLLSALIPILQDRKKIPILVSPTCAELDTASEALIQIFDGLESYGLVNNEFGKVRNPKLRFHDKVDIAQNIIKKNRKNVVLLVDEPNEWAIRSKEDPLYYVGENKQSRSLAQQMRTGFDCAKVIVERSLNTSLDVGWTQLDDANAVNEPSEITSFADELSRILFAKPALKRERSFLGLRLLSALQSLGDDSYLQPWPNEFVLANHFFEIVTFTRSNTQLVKLLCKLALVRGEISESMLNSLGINAGLPEVDQRLVREAFLTSCGNDSYSMHPLLKNVISNSGMLSLSETNRAHEQIADFHLEHLESLRRQHRQALLVEYRGFDQFAKAGFASIDRVSHFFVSQLHVWGRCLSRDLRQYREAADIFERAVQEDPLDDYGHHYKAYNLDYIAMDEQATERHYRLAVELNPLHPWYWSRWINFLITTGRMNEACEEWRNAGSALSAPDNCEEAIFRHLHFWVAQLLVQRAQLDFAKQILNEVPNSVRKSLSQFAELDRLLESLFIARDERAVFPAYISPSEYWSDYPHLRQPFQWNNAGLTSFYSARVEHWREAEVDLVVGVKEGDEVRYGLFSFTHDEFKKSLVGFDWSNREKIRFVELCFYGESNLMRIDVYPSLPPNETSLPNLDPPNPNRYLEGWKPRS